MEIEIEQKSCLAPDGVKIVYSAAGVGKTALVFIHGGLADRTFFDGQLKAFGSRYRVIALDLAGHGAAQNVHFSRQFAAGPVSSADPDTDSDPDPENLSHLLAESSSINGSPERLSLSGSHGLRPWV